MPKPPAGTNLKQHRGDLSFAKTFRRSSSQCDQVAWMAEPFISPLSLTMTPALSSNGDFWIDMDFQVKGLRTWHQIHGCLQFAVAICYMSENGENRLPNFRPQSTRRHLHVASRPSSGESPPWLTIWETKTAKTKNTQTKGNIINEKMKEASMHIKQTLRPTRNCWK